MNKCVFSHSKIRTRGYEELLGNGKLGGGDGGGGGGDGGGMTPNNNYSGCFSLRFSPELTIARQSVVTSFVKVKAVHGTERPPCSSSTRTMRSRY